MPNSGEMQPDNFQNTLPEGWVVEIRERQNGRRDKYYISPNGIKFNSKVRVCRYLGLDEIDIPMENEGCNVIRVASVNNREISNVGGIARNDLLENAKVGLPPPAWEVKVRERNNGGIYKIYVDPVTGYNFRSIKEVSRYLQTGEFPSRRAKKKCVSGVDSTEQEFSLSSRAKIRKLARNSKRRRSLFTDQISNTTNAKNNELVLKSDDVQCFEEVESYDDRGFVLLPSDPYDLEDSEKDTVCTTVTCAVPLSMFYPKKQVVQPSIAKHQKRKTKSRPGKAQNKREPVNKKPKPNPPKPKPENEHILPSRTSRRLAGLKPELSSETSNVSQDVPVEVSPEVDTALATCSLSIEEKVNELEKTLNDKGENFLEENMKKLECERSDSSTKPDTMKGDDDVPNEASSMVHELCMMIQNVNIKPSLHEEKEVVRFADIQSPRLEEEEEEEEESLASIMKKRKRIRKKPSRLEEQETMTCMKRKRKYICSQKGKAKARSGKTPKVTQRICKVKVRVANEKASMPKHMEATLKSIGGRYIELIHEKEITASDVNKSQARLYLPAKIENFLSESEKKYLKETPKNGLEVVVVDNKCETWNMSMKYWPSVEDYILVKNWPKIIEVNEIEAGKHVLEIWTFRQCSSQEEEDGEKKKGKLGFALNFWRWESLGTEAEVDNQDSSVVGIEEGTQFLGIEEKANVPVEATHSLGVEEHENDPWKTHAKEHTRKVESSSSGTIITLPFPESTLDPCLEFAYKTLMGLIPIENLPLNLASEW